MVAWSSACSHHLYLPCFSDRFCRCPWALLLPLPPEWASLEFGITFVAPPWLRCSKEPRDTMSWCASHCWLQTSQDAKTDVEKHPNIIPKRSRVADKGCSTKSLISTPNFWAGKIPFKCFSAMLGTKSWKELLAQATTGDFGKMDWGGRGRRETTSSAPRGGRQPAQTLRCQQRPPWERPPSLGVPCLKMAPSASPPHRAGAAAPTRVWRRRYRPPPQLRPPLQGAGRGSRGCSLGSWCLRPFRLEDEAAGGRTFAGGAFLRRLLPARLGACQLLWGGRGERGLQGENSHGRARHGRSPPSPRKHREGLARLGVSAARGGDRRVSPHSAACGLRPFSLRRQPLLREANHHHQLPLPWCTRCRFGFWVFFYGENLSLSHWTFHSAPGGSFAGARFLVAASCGGGAAAEGGRLWRGPAPRRRSGPVRSLW